MTTPTHHPRLAGHLHFVATNSPYYRKLWKGSYAGTHTPLAALPTAALDTYWSANQPDGNQVLTTIQLDGPIFKSGGTTGNPKFSFFSNEDWRALCSAFGAGMKRGGLKPGEPIANMFYGGQMYASFLFIGRAIEQAGEGVQFPLSGAAPEAEIIKTLQQFRIETLAGVPTSLLALLPALAATKPGSIQLKRFLYGGEAIFPDQIAALQRVLPGCAVQSVGIAGVDYGELGWSEPDTHPGIHRCFDYSTVLEILDDSGRQIQEPGDIGELVITNFKRRLMPIVRYPVGDRGQWVDPPGTPFRRFQVLGRSNNCARIGPVSLYAEDVQNVLSHVPGSDCINFQLLIEHIEQRDRCTLRIAVAAPQAVAPGLGQKVIDALHRERPMIADLTGQGVIHPVIVQWVEPRALITNARTGKTPRVVDRRQEPQP